MTAPGGGGSRALSPGLLPDDRRGFTLIELLIVTLILGILAMIAVPKVQSAREKAYDAAALSDLRSVENAIELYVTQNYTYPSDVSQLSSVGYTPSPGIEFTRFKLERKGGEESIHIHVGHEGSTHYYHIRYPKERTPELRNKKK